MIDEARQFELLKKISFERIGGSCNEEKAADMIIEALMNVGITAYKEEFEVNATEGLSASLEVREPYCENIPVTGYICCGNTDEDGLEAELVYFEHFDEVSKKRAKNKIVLVNGYVGKKIYEEIVEAGALGFISFNGHLDQAKEKVDLDQRELRTPDNDLKLLPGVNIKVFDAIRLIEKKASKVKLTVNQKPIKVKSHNVICELKGTSDTEEIICFTAHYDSVPFSKGAYDNATGSVCLFELASYFKKNPSSRNLKFIWCGSEERGLLGAKAYCQSHQEELKDVRLCINVDMIGSILGKRIAVATASNELVSYIDYYAKIIGYPLTARQGVYSSDSTPFADHGVPAVSFARITPAGGGDIHNRFDIIEHLSSSYLKEDTEFILKFSENLINSYVFPIKKEIPQNMKDEIDKYYNRKK